MAATAACASLLLAACVPGLSDDAGLYFGRNDGSEAISERQTVEVYISDTAPRYAASLRTLHAKPVVFSGLLAILDTVVARRRMKQMSISLGRTCTSH
jgi:hypothetical protein